MAELSKAAKMRAIEEDIPLELLAGLGAAYIPPEEIEETAHLALFGRTRQEDEESGEGDASFGGINRYIFVGESRPFIDPAGTLLWSERRELRQLRRARGADPQALRVRPKTAHQKRTMQHQPLPPGGGAAT